MRLGGLYIMGIFGREKTIEEINAQYEKEMAREREKYQRRRQRDIRRTMRRAHVKPDASREEIDNAFLAHIMDRRTDLQEVALGLTDEQIRDSRFMLAMYRNRPDMLSYARPRTEELLGDVDFMRQYLSLEYDRRCPKDKNGKHQRKSYFDLHLMLSGFGEQMKNPAFVEMLAEVFPEDNIIYTVKRCMPGYTLFDDKKKEEDIQTLLASLSTDMLCEQARRFGKEAIRELPKTLPGHSDIVSAGIECDGFDSLALLDIKKVLENKDLIFKAYEHSSVKDLSFYLRNTVSPHRTQYYMCHGEPHDYNYYDSDYEVVQNALLGDFQIHMLFKKEAENNRTAKSPSRDKANTLAFWTQYLAKKNPEMAGELSYPPQSAKIEDFMGV